MTARPIYLDYAATTPVDAEVVSAMVATLGQDGVFGNPASNTHAYGWEAKELVDEARENVAQLIGAEARDIIWTSGATESTNLALKGVMQANQHRGKHLITVETEHKSVLDVASYLGEVGFDVTVLKPDAQGVVSVSQVAEAMRDDTVLISVMYVNNETGVIQDIPGIGLLARERKVYFHVDAVQAAGKVPIDVQQMQIDLMSLSAHKIYGPKGAGALYIRRKPRIRVAPLIHGGGHEQGYRSGTLATHQIVGMGKAFALAKARFDTDVVHLRLMRDRLWAGLSSLSQIIRHSADALCAPHILNVSFDGVDGEALILALDGCAVSSGSACTSASIEPSHVLAAMGVDQHVAHRSIRFSVGRMTTVEEVDLVIEAVVREVVQLRSISPLWADAQMGMRAHG